MNKTVTIWNVPPDGSFYSLPLEYLKADHVCFNALSDPFWPKYREELLYFLKEVPRLAKLVTAVTKFPIKKEMMKRLSEISNFRLVVSITGLDSIEKTSTVSRLRTLDMAMEMGLKAFPLVHPYIAGMSDLSFLPSLRRMCYDYIGIKGFRSNRNMEWLPDASKKLYFTRTQEEDEILIDDGWSQMLNEAGITLTSLKTWYQSSCNSSPLKLSYSEAEYYVEKLLKTANITSSSTEEEVKKHSILRRL
jgi:DNA repair photolyase